MHRNPDERKILYALFFERDGSLNLTWLFVLIMGLAGVGGFIYSLKALTIIDRVVGWSFLGGSFMAVLLAALPISKAKLLSESRLPTNFASILMEAGGVGPPVTGSTDMQENYSGSIAPVNMAPINNLTVDTGSIDISAGQINGAMLNVQPQSPPVPPTTSSIG